MHGMISKFTLLIKFTGMVSGLTYTTPVSYSQFGRQVYIFTHANWWKNLRGGKPVTLLIRGHEYDGLAYPVIEDKDAIADKLTAHLKQVRSDAGYYSVTYDEKGNPRADEVMKAVQTVVMICVQLD